MRLFYAPSISSGDLTLDEEESKHAIKVLRLKNGDALTVTDGKGKIYQCIVTAISRSTCSFSIQETITTPSKNYTIHIGIAPTKNIDRIEWFVEKATELGIDEISFFYSSNSERRAINLERIGKKSISAMKQSGQACLPKIHDIKPFKDVLKFDGEKFIAHVDHTNKVLLKHVQPAGHYLVLIGPEGDFTLEEIQLATSKGFSKVSLGPSVLRTETAGLVACHLLNLIQQ